MSSILDALKKSERQRSLGRDLIFRSASADAAPRLTGFAIAVLCTLLLLALAIGALLYSLREPELPVAALIVEATQPADGGTTAIQGDSQATAVTAPAISTDKDRGAGNTSLSGSQKAPATSKSASPKPEKSANTPRRPAPSPPNTGEAPWLSSLPSSFRSSLPPLVVNIHVYSPEESQRILYINNRQARQGEQIEGGVVVEEIVRDGAILQYRGQRFKLPRPS